MIRAITPADTPELLTVCESTGLFSGEDLPTLQLLFDDYHVTKSQQGHQALVFEEEEELVAVAYFTPKELTDRTWELLMIMVHSSRQTKGIGSRMIEACQEQISSIGGRLLLIETSSTDDFEPIWRFYRKHGFRDVATVPDYYADSIGKVTFLKRL
jgi:ribosomal protein S18 acetylase RimI-like enzyme